MTTETTNRCIWEEDADGGWYAECRKYFTFNQDGPAENYFIYCPFCGLKIVATEWEEEEE